MSAYLGTRVCVSKLLRQSRKSNGRKRAEGNEVTYLPVGDLPETLKNLLGCVLILGHTDHEPDELLERHVPAPACDVPKRFFHLPLVVHQSQAGERSAELKLMQRIG